MKLEIAADKLLVHETRIAIRWGDMDAMGHVNNTVYFRYLEIARVEWLDRLKAAPNPAGQGPVIANAFCNFYQQLEYPGEVLAKHYVSNSGRSSFDSWTTLERVDQPGVICAAGGATTVWVDFPSKKSSPLPDWLRAAISP
ncbi:acyl-CoA thioesterase [Roseateles sp. GG27B]